MGEALGWATSTRKGDVAVAYRDERTKKHKNGSW